MELPLNRSRAIGILIIAAISISFSPAIVKLLGREILGPTVIAFWRTAIGGIALVLIARIEGKSLRMAPVPLAWCLFTGTFLVGDCPFH